jgi:hypothetical protein
MASLLRSGKATEAVMAKAKVSKPAARAEAGQRHVAKTANARSGTTATGAPAKLSPEEVYRLIQESAYFKAKARGFAPGHEVQDWIEAEAEVRRRLENRAQA